MRGFFRGGIVGPIASLGTPKFPFGGPLLELLSQTFVISSFEGQTKAPVWTLGFSAVTAAPSQHSLSKKSEAQYLLHSL